MTKVDNIADLQLVLGEELGVSDWLTIDQDRINRFADATGDYQWIHLDVEKSRNELQRGTTIAHGYLIVSLIPLLTSPLYTIEHNYRRLNYGSNRVRFISEVATGSRIRARQRLKSLEQNYGALALATFEITIEIEGQDRPACIAETITAFLPCVLK